MADWTLEDALRMALKLEKENYADYQKGAEEADIPSLKKMFFFLAEEEKKHIKLIRDKMNELKLPE
jgi:rubrerythrin